MASTSDAINRAFAQMEVFWARGRRHDSKYHLFRRNTGTRCPMAQRLADPIVSIPSDKYGICHYCGLEAWELRNRGVKIPGTWE